MAQILYFVASLHILLCPFTKVEESFNIQAFHDILYHKHNLSEYDHNEFPGVVPRTFLGPLFISAVASPIVGILHLIGMNKFWMQYVVRLVLCLCVIGAWSRFRNALQKQFGNTYSWWLTLLTVSQYHYMFYMSRPLPNIITLPLVLLAYEGWILDKQKQFIISAGASIIIFRSELAMLFGLFLIIDLQFKRMDLTTLLKIAVPAGAGLIALTVVVDSIFWRRLLWPEAEVFWYNTVMNKSSDWGTSPFLWYFYSALPRGLGPSLVLIPVGLYLDKRVVQYAAPAIVYILLYSFLPHKELRFIIYVFPLLNMASAAACSYVYLRRTKAPIYELLFWGIVVLVIGNIALTLALTSVAINNYPGGVAILRLHKLLRTEHFVHVHIDNLAAQTGVTRFTQINNHWAYSKNESLQSEHLQDFTHLLIEAKSKYSPNLKPFTHTHVILEHVEAFSQVAVNYKLFPMIKIKTKPTIFILERKDFRQHPYGYNVEAIGGAQEISKDSETEPASIEEYNNPELESKSVEVEETTTPETVDLEPEQVMNTNYDNDVQNIDLKNIENSNKDVKPVDEILPAKAKTSLEEARALRKKKIADKIKSDTRKKVAASAKEKLKEIMKRHKRVAVELSESVLIKEEIINIGVENNLVPEKESTMILEEKDGRGDIPDIDVETIIEESEDKQEETVAQTSSVVEELATEESLDESVAQNNEVINRTNENINLIVEEVIARLIDRKVYDDKTKPEDINAEDRLVIQQIVEEVLFEKMNYTKYETV